MINPSRKLIASLSRQRRSVQLAIVLAAVAVMGLIDFFTGYEISFSLFYLAPIAYATWFLGFRTGMMVSVLSMVSWHLAGRFAGEAFSSSAIPYWNALIRLGFFITVSYLLTQIKSLQEHEKMLARIDFLTGVDNVRAFSDKAHAEIQRQRRFHRPFSLAYIDLDDFKSINDRFGHSRGDELLKQVAQTIQNNMRQTDAVARLGGDEFAVLMPETDADAARKATEKLIHRLGKTMRRQPRRVTFSIGVVTFQTPPPDLDHMIKLADELMYAAKKRGKDTALFQLYQDPERS